VAGSRGFTGLRRFLVGSTSACVVESEAARSCLVVRSSLHASCESQPAGEAAAVSELATDITTPAPRVHGRVVAIAVDGSSAGMALVQYCRQFLLRATDKVFVVNGRPDNVKARRCLADLSLMVCGMSARILPF